jgi:hypothetical protein
VPALPASSDPLAELQAENDDLRAQLDFVRNHSLDTWLRVVHSSGIAVRDYENTLSWRVTRPLRLVRRVQVAVREMGIGPVVAAGVRRIRTKLRVK